MAAFRPILVALLTGLLLAGLFPASATSAGPRVVDIDPEDCEERVPAAYAAPAPRPAHTGARHGPAGRGDEAGRRGAGTTRPPAERSRGAGDPPPPPADPRHDRPRPDKRRGGGGRGEGGNNRKSTRQNSRRVY